MKGKQIISYSMIYSLLFCVLVTLFSIMIDIIVSTPLILGRKYSSITVIFLKLLEEAKKVNLYLFYAFYFFPVWGFPLVLYSYFRYKNIKKEAEEREIKVKYKIILFSLAILIAILITMYRYLYYPYIQGFDIPAYYIPLTKLAAQSLQNLSRISIRWRRPLFLIIVVSIYRMGVPAEIIYFYYPAVVGCLYIFSAYYFVKKGLNEEIAHLAAITAPISFFFIRLSYDLLTNFLAVCIAYVSLGKYIEVKVRGEEKKRKDIFCLVLVLIILVFVHPWTAAIIFGIVMLNEFLEFLMERKFLLGSWRSNLGIFAVVVVLLIIILLYAKVYRLLALDVRIWEVEWYWMIYRESAAVLFLSLLGLILTMLECKLNKKFAILISTWVFVLSLLLYVPLRFYRIWAYRVYMLYPFGVLQAISMYFMADKVESVFKNFLGFKVRGFKVLLSIVLVLLVLTSVLPSALIHEYVYRPDNVTMEQIREMSELFGFQNESVVYVLFNSPAKPLDPKTSPHVFGWMRAYLGDNIYEGHLLELLNGQPDVRGRVYDVSNKTVVLGDKVYMMTDLELTFCREVENGIYILKVTNYTFQQLEEILFTRYLEFYDFYVSKNNWHIVTRTLNVSLRYVEEEGGYKLVISIDENTTGWLTMEKYLSPEFNTTGLQSLITRVYSDTTNITILVEVYYANGKVKGRIIDGFSGDFWIVVPIIHGEELTKIRVAIKVDEPLQSGGLLTLNYLLIL